jgi:SAM-dependent methyltransferase
MDWVESFYSTTGRWWGPAESAITSRDHERVTLIRNICGPAAMTLLELGCGYGSTAAAAAAHGFRVTGVDISGGRLEFARQHADPASPGALRFVHENFYSFTAPHTFDVVCYFNGFGVGTDADQRDLLRLVARQWLAPGGLALIDVANPLVWAGWAGDVDHKPARPDAGYRYSLEERTDFDPVGFRFTDTWWERDQPERRYTQSVRCYSPADFGLLLEGTGLRLRAVYVAGEPVEPGTDHTGRPDLLTSRHEWLAVLAAGNLAGGYPLPTG